MVGVGDVLAGKYRVEQVLGKGGMGYVVAAMHTQLDQRVAVKFMVPELCEHPEAVARFLREARAAVRIRSEHVARVLDVGTMDDGTPYMVMEFLWGRDLATELEEVKQLAVSQAADYVLQACEALAEAHAYGIVHRDLKPANLFLTRRPDGSAQIKVLDFGISKAATDQAAPASESLTASQSLIGSPHYMSPEQVRRPKTVDSRSDIWALGVILHELISGDRPFGGDTPMSVLAAVVSDPAPRLRDLRPELSVGVEKVILRCLEKEPANRYASVADLASALAPYASAGNQQLVLRIQGIARNQAQQSQPAPGSGASGSVGAVTPSSALESGPATMPSPNVLTEARPRKTETDWGRSGIDRSSRSGLKWVFGGVAALVAVGVAMYALGNSRSVERTTERDLVAGGAATSTTAALPAWPPARPSRPLESPQPTATPSPVQPTIEASAPADAANGASPRPQPARARRKPRPAAADALPASSARSPLAAPDPLDERR